jgi:hypothetical protein
MFEGEVPIHLGSRMIFSTVSGPNCWAKAWQETAMRNSVKSLFIIIESG